MVLNILSSSIAVLALISISAYELASYYEEICFYDDYNHKIICKSLSKMVSFHVLVQISY